MTVNWEKLDALILKAVQSSTNVMIESETFEIGEDVSVFPQFKITFDGFGDDGDDETMASFALYIHKEAKTDGFTFPEHELTPWSIVQRPDEEAIVFCWYNREAKDWDILEPETENEIELNAGQLIVILEYVLA